MSDTTTPTPTTPIDSTIEARTSGRHPVNIGYLVMGLAFLGLVGVWALVQSEMVTGDDIRWLLPVPWVLAGIAGLTVTAVTSSRRYTTRQTGWVGAGSPPDHTTETAPTDTEENR